MNHGDLCKGNRGQWHLLYHMCNPINSVAFTWRSESAVHLNEYEMRVRVYACMCTYGMCEI